MSVPSYHVNPNVGTKLRRLLWCTITLVQQSRGEQPALRESKSAVNPATGRIEAGHHFAQAAIGGVNGFLETFFER